MTVVAGVLRPVVLRPPDATCGLSYYQSQDSQQTENELQSWKLLLADLFLPFCQQVCAAAIEEIELQENFESHQSGLCLLLWLRLAQKMEVRCPKCNGHMLWSATSSLETGANIIKN
mgnify:CR=1 FL=1